MSQSKLTHLDEAGRAHMVDVGEKAITERSATAISRLRLSPQALEAVWTGGAAKGDALGVARVAGIMAAKRTGDLIPLCHPLGLTHVSVAFARGQEHIWVRATARCKGQTGVEMEAMTAASVAALTLYDMTKAMDKAMIVEQVALLHKAGGRSGDFHHPQREGLTPPGEPQWR